MLEWNLQEAASHQLKSTEVLFLLKMSWKAHSDKLKAYSKYPTSK